MKSRKGMSQVLSLIVAASVLMMTALLVIMFTSGSLTGFFKDTGVTSCTSTVKAQCSAGAQSVELPSTCYGSDGKVKTGVQNQLGIGPSASEYQCQT
ncbi:MAG: hypothetical protein ABEK16_03645 [Candidatus Nanohalobium sp.]